MPAEPAHPATPPGARLDDGADAVLHLSGAWRLGALPTIVDALDALSLLGYKPRIPVPLSDFADPVKRGLWTRDKLSLIHI